jgi:hypothetical protein
MKKKMTKKQLKDKIKRMEKKERKRISDELDMMWNKYMSEWGCSCFNCNKSNCE